MDQCSTGVIDAPSTQRQIPNQKQIDFIKDEYLFLDTFDNKQYFTDDYHEYEQGQAQIIVKGRLKTHFFFFFFGKVLVSIHVKKIVSLVGQIISMSYVIGNVAHIMI